MDDALGYYRGIIRGSRPPAQYAELHEHWLYAPRLPTLYLHGTDDGCFEDYTPWIERMLPDESEIALVKNGGHFLQLDQPDASRVTSSTSSGRPRDPYFVLGSGS